MRIEAIDIGKVNPAPYNPRKDLQPTDPEYQALKLAIETHGFVEPLVWNEATGYLVGGHQRYKILVNELKAKKVWCSVVNITDEKAEKALNLSLNKISGEWDFPKLQEILFTFDENDQAFVTASGFSALEVEQILQWKETQTSSENLEQTPAERLQTFNDGAIKQIVLYFPAKEYDGILRRLETVREKEDVDDNTSAFVRLLENYEKSTRVSKTAQKKSGKKKV